MLFSHKSISFLAVTGISSSVTGLSTLGIPNLISYSCDNLGLGKTFLLEAAFTAILILLSFFLLSDSPEKSSTEPFARTEKNDSKKIVGKAVVYKPVLTKKPGSFFFL